MKKVRENICYSAAIAGMAVLIGSFAALGQGWISGTKCIGIAGLAAVAIVVGMAEAEGE